VAVLYYGVTGGWLHAKVVLVAILVAHHGWLGKSDADYHTKTYLALLLSSGKKAATVITERGHLQHWRQGLGHLRLDKIRPNHVQTAFNQMLKKLKPRTCDGALVALTSLLKAGKRDNYLKVLPTAEIKRFKADKKNATFTLKEIELACMKGLEASINVHAVVLKPWLANSAPTRFAV
jgi:hypothetical protein